MSGPRLGCVGPSWRWGYVGAMLGHLGSYVGPGGTTQNDVKPFCRQTQKTLKNTQ